MKFLFDLFPFILMFGTLKWSESHLEIANFLASEYLSRLVSGGSVKADIAAILLATSAALFAILLQICFLLIRRKRIGVLLWGSFSIILIFGSATIYFQNPNFILWKPTVLYWCIASVFLVSQVLFNKNLIRMMMEKQITLPDAVWESLSFVYVIFFIATGVLNLYVAFNFSFSDWVSFKILGMSGLTLAFLISQSIWLGKYIEEPS